MGKIRYSAEQLCQMYPHKYIAVNHICKDDCEIIVGAEILKVYDTLEQCKKSIDEIKFFMKIYKDDFDIIYGDYEDYSKNRCRDIAIKFDEFAIINENGEIVIDAFRAFGAIALFGNDSVDNLLKCIDDAKKDDDKRTGNG